MRGGRTFSITVSIATIIVALLAGLAAVLVGYNYLQNRRQALLAAGELLDRTGAIVFDHTEALAERAARLLELAARSGELRSPAFHDTRPAETLMQSVLLGEPELSAVLAGFDDGGLVEVVALGPPGSEARTATRSPDAAAFAVRIIEPQRDGARLGFWRFVDADGAQITGRADGRASYDPRTRPWYEAARAAPGVVTTEPYVFALDRVVGLTIAQALPGAPVGVVGLDLTLDGLSALLRDQPLPSDALIMLFHENGDVIAHSGEGPATHAGGGPLGDGPRLARVDELDDPRAPALFAEYVAAHRAGDGHTVSVDGRRFLAWSAPLHAEHWADTHLGILAPEDLFVGPYRAIGRRSLLISLALLALALPIGVLAARAMGRPLRRLAAEAEEVRQFRLGGPVGVRSFVTEIETLARSMEAMKGGLRTFGRYVPAGLVRRIVETGGEPHLGGERRELSLLFTDIEGFTSFAERESPEAVMGRLSRYLEALTAALMARHGTIDKFIGDSIMAFWNAPAPDPDHVEHACAAALAALAAGAALNREWQDAGLPAWRTRIGLHVGECVVGNVGSADRMNYTAIGAAVNLASRLEGLNGVYGTAILASEAVADRARGRFAFRAAGLVRPKNIADPIAVYELLGLREDVDRAELDAWEAARRAFLERRFDEAAARFAVLATARPQDGLARTYRTRAEALRADPPPPEWRGVEAPTDK